MNIKLHKRIVFTIICIIILCMGVLVSIGTDERSFEQEDILQRITFNGRYEVDSNGTWLPLSESMDELSRARHRLTAIGNFSEDIPINKQIIMRIDNMQVKVFVENEQVYSFGESGTYPGYSKSAGNGWDSFISSGIASTDTVRIELTNIYTNHADTVFFDFFNRLYYGYESDLIIKLIGEKSINLFFSIFTFCLGLIALFFCILLYPIHKIVRRSLCFSGLSIFAGLWFFIDFDIQGYLIPSPVFNNSLDIICMIMTEVCLVSYLAMQLRTKWKTLLIVEAVFNVSLIPIATLTQVLGILDYYHFIDLITGIGVIEGVSILVLVLYEQKRFGSKDNLPLLYSTIVMSLGLFMDVFVNVWEYLPSLIWFKAGFLIFLIIQFWKLANSAKEIISESTRVKLLEAQKKDLIQRAQKDSLTGLFNKAVTHELIADALHEKEPGNLAAFFMIDIDHFKTINDTYGHVAGDLVISMFAKRLKEQFREDDIVGRIGGDEFVVFFWISSEEWVWQKAKELNAALAEEINLENDICNVSASIGIAFSTQNTADFESLYQSADEALYRAKAAGRNRYSI